MEYPCSRALNIIRKRSALVISIHMYPPIWHLITCTVSQPCGSFSKWLELPGITVMIQTCMLFHRAGLCALINVLCQGEYGPHLLSASCLSDGGVLSAIVEAGRSYYSLLSWVLCSCEPLFSVWSRRKIYLHPGATSCTSSWPMCRYRPPGRMLRTCYPLG